MSEELHDEITSINAIYGSQTLALLSSNNSHPDEDEDEAAPRLYALTFPSQPSISIRIAFPRTYPDTAPPAIRGTQSVGEDAAKGDGVYLVDLAREVLTDVYTPGAACVFDLVEEVGNRLRELGLAAGDLPPGGGEEEEEEEEEGEKLEGVEASLVPSSSGFAPSAVHRTASQHDPAADPSLAGAPDWAVSDVVTAKKSVFVARAAPATSALRAAEAVRVLVASDKKAAKATHNISAWRIRRAASGGAPAVEGGCDDDGESAAGARLLHLLELMDVCDLVVVVSRWYGGVPLGPDRFRIINQTAREAVVRGGFWERAADEGDGKGGKKKGKK